MNLVWENNFKVTAFDVDAFNRLRINRGLDYFQDAASNDAERRGFGYKDFVPNGLFWVLSWIKIEFLYHSKFMDEIKIQTWGKKQHKLYSIRDFLFLNNQGKIIAKGTSAWILLDVKSLRPKSLPQLYPNIKMLDTKNALNDLPHKINSSEQVEIVYSKSISYSDIDLNNHTNNSKYIEMLMDCFAQNFHKQHSVKSLTASFNSETKFGEVIDFYKGELKSNYPSHYVEAKNKSTNRLILQAQIEWSSVLF